MRRDHLGCLDVQAAGLGGRIAAGLGSSWLGSRAVLLLLQCCGGCLHKLMDQDPQEILQRTYAHGAPMGIIVRGRMPEKQPLGLADYSQGFEKGKSRKGKLRGGACLNSHSFVAQRLVRDGYSALKCSCLPSALAGSCIAFSGVSFF